MKCGRWYQVEILTGYSEGSPVAIKLKWSGPVRQYVVKQAIITQSNALHLISVVRFMQLFSAKNLVVR